MYKTILIPVNGTERSMPLQKAALEVGSLFTSHVIGLHIVPSLQSLQSIADHQFVSYEIYQQLLENETELAEKDKTAFNEFFNASTVNYEWLETEGHFSQNMKNHARTSDLAIVPQGEDQLGDVMGDIPDFILNSGIPSLAVPRDRREKSFAQNIFIAWNGSKESIHAVHAALPFLKLAKNVTVLSVCEENKDEIKTADICKNLARHDVNVSGMTIPLHVNPGAKLLEVCQEKRADLIVSGAWAHSRLTELIYGGVTKTLFNNQQIPVFFAH
ncbi:MAG TPA: universal stress protein [Emcibacteraceae bacterium]|nr:universal stress protein [Emcibacteraceae bacterium]HRW29155.1 universal stress protein [Emcibacteraceae bacterium]